MMCVLVDFLYAARDIVDTHSISSFETYFKINAILTLIIIS
jgi:hypothetical protein